MLVRIPHLFSNIPSSIFYGSFYSERLRIGRSALPFSDFLPNTAELYRRIVAQGGMKPAKKMFQKYPTHLSKYNKTFDEIWDSLVANNSLNF